MDKLTEYTFASLLTFFWILGFVLAEGFWQTFACLFPFYAFYLDIEFLLGIISLT